MFAWSNNKSLTLSGFRGSTNHVFVRICHCRPDVKAHPQLVAAGVFSLTSNFVRAEASRYVFGGMSPPIFGWRCLTRDREYSMKLLCKDCAS